ncbi:MAG TPA: hypothetical protein O0W90_04110 [Methanocorpusculum sp.]|nr:hypothetical protein [Methanocorpusculum sp.]
MVSEKKYRTASLVVGFAVLILSSLIFAETLPWLPVVLFAAVLIIFEMLLRHAKKMHGESLYGEAWGDFIEKPDKDKKDDDDDWMYDD